MVSRRAGLRDRWRDDHVIPNREIGDACKVLLLVLASRMTDRGSVSVPREQLAKELDVHPQRITDRISEAKRTGLLQQAGGGHRGRTAQYVAVIPSKGNRSAVTNSGKGNGLAVTFERLPFRPANLRETASELRKVTAEQLPNARVTKRKPQTHADERNVRGEREHGQEQGRSDRRVTRVIRLAELSPWAQLGYAPLLRRTA
jgi:hypothetical protein